MSPFQVFFLHTGFVGFTFVLLVFLLFVPFYRTFVGSLIFCVKVNFWLILLLVLLRHHGLDPEGTSATVIRNIVYPFTTFTGFALFAVVLRTQIVGRKERGLESTLFNKEDHHAPHQ